MKHILRIGVISVWFLILAAMWSAAYNMLPVREDTLDHSIWILAIEVGKAFLVFGVTFGLIMLTPKLIKRVYG